MSADSITMRHGERGARAGGGAAGLDGGAVSAAASHPLLASRLDVGDHALEHDELLDGYACVRCGEWLAHEQVFNLRSLPASEAYAQVYALVQAWGPCKANAIRRRIRESLSPALTRPPLTVRAE